MAKRSLVVNVGLRWQFLLFLAVIAPFELIIARATDIVDGDSGFSAFMVRYEVFETSKIIGLRNNFMFGLGNIQWGLVQWLNPFSLVGLVSTEVYNAGLVGLAASALLFLCTWAFVTSFGIGGVRRILVSYVVPMVLVVPGALPVVVPDQFRLTPSFALLLCLQMTTTIAFRSSKSRSHGTRCVAYVSFLVSLLWIIYVLPHRLVLVLPFLAITIAVSFSGTIRLEGWRFALRTQGLLVVSALLVLGALRAPQFVLGFLLNTAVVEIKESTRWVQPGIRPVPEFVLNSLFPMRSRSSDKLALVFLACLAFYVVEGGAKKASRTQLWLITVISLTFSLGYRLSQTVWDYEYGPEHGYFVWMMVPLYGIAVADTVCGLCHFVGRSISVRVMHLSMVRIVVVPVVALAFLMSPLSTWRNLERREELQGTLSRDLELIKPVISLASDDRFRGRVLIADGMSASTAGSAMFHKLPLLNDYSHLVTPQMYRFFGQFLFAPSDIQSRNHFVYRKFDTAIWRLLGVRYVIGDIEQVPPSNESFRVDATSHILEVMNPNVGDYSPVSVVVPARGENPLDLVARYRSSLETVVILQRDISAPLVSATESTLRLIDGDLRFTASSPSNSIIVLPLEFSNCLSVVVHQGDTPKLMRADFALTGIEFHGSIDVTLNFRTGLFSNPSCRLQDLREFRQLMTSNTAGR